MVQHLALHVLVDSVSTLDELQGQAQHATPERVCRGCGRLSDLRCAGAQVCFAGVKLRGGWDVPSSCVL